MNDTARSIMVYDSDWALSVAARIEDLEVLAATEAGRVRALQAELAAIVPLSAADAEYIARKRDEEKHVAWLVAVFHRYKWLAALVGVLGAGVVWLLKTSITIEPKA